jgi:hypothetical protein
VKLFDVLPPRPRGAFTSAATFRPTRSLPSACRIARSSEFLVICSDRVEYLVTISPSADRTSPALSEHSGLAPRP